MTDGLKDEHREAIIAAIAANDRVERARPVRIPRNRNEHRRRMWTSPCSATG